MAKGYRVENFLEALRAETRLNYTFNVDAMLTWFETDAGARDRLGLVLSGKEDVGVFDCDAPRVARDHAVKLRHDGVDIPNTNKAYATRMLAYRVEFFKRGGGLDYDERFLRFLAWYPAIRPANRSQELAKLLSGSKRLKKRLCNAVESGGEVDVLLDEVDFTIRMYGKNSVINTATSPGALNAVRNLRSLIGKYRQIYGIEEKARP